MTFKAVLFDAAETLFTTRGTVGEIYGAIARQYGSTASPEEIQAAFVRQFRGSGPLSAQNQKEWWKDVVYRVFSETGMIEDFDRYFEQVYDRFRGAQGWVLFPETIGVLSDLKARSLKLGVISNFDDRIYEVMRSLGILAFFDAVTISSETGFAKPDPRIFMAAAKALDAAPPEILVVGDSLDDDVEAAMCAGMQAILIDRDDRHASLHVERIRSLREVPRILFSN